MTPERWRLIGELFDEASCLSAEAAKEWLGETCGADAVLRYEVMALLASDYVARSGFVRGRVHHAVMSLFAETEPRRIGCYRVIREIGRGGMGRVFLAVPEGAPQQTPVAVKLIRPVFATRANVYRFSRESEILKQLRHPNIVTLLGGGFSSDGSPYLVLEYIRGVKITDYCRSHDLDVAGRLRIILQIFSALEHAHRHHILHRDLKPGNMLVDHAGTARLLDFGISKPLLSSSPATTGMATTGVLVLTPEYASPEQIRGERVTVASDIYSLGVVLKELLAECRLSRGLDHILDRALEPNPARRYATVAQFSAELRRHLETSERREPAGSLKHKVLGAVKKLCNALQSAHRLVIEQWDKGPQRFRDV
jgi:serine/threonine protein kinase